RVEATMRLMLIVVTVAVAMLLDLRVSQATQMPWCAGTSTGHSFHYNCSLPTYEMCVQEVIAGNRGFCSPNPYYRGPEGPPPRPKGKPLLLWTAFRRGGESPRMRAPFFAGVTSSRTRRLRVLALPPGYIVALLALSEDEAPLHR